MQVKENFLELKGYRLPTDPEREFSCRAGSKSTFLFGNQQKYIHQYGHSTKEATVHPVGLLKPNGFGFFDMYGNGTNWVLDVDLPRFAEEHSKAIGSTVKERLIAMRSGEKLLDRPILQPVEDTISRLMWGVLFEYSYATNSCHPNDRLLEINLSIRPVRTLRTIQLTD